MDTKYLENLLKSMNEIRDSIKKTANYCASYPESSGLIVFMIEEEFKLARKDRKKLYIYLIHEIILEDRNLKRAEHPYIRQFGQKLKAIFTEYSNVIDSIQDMDAAYTIIKRWEKDQIYHPNFLDKLRLILQPKYDQIRLQQETFNALNQKDASTHKVLQHNIQIVQGQEQSAKVYGVLKKLSDIDNQSLDFNSDKLQNQKQQNVQDLIDQGEHYRQQLIQGINDLVGQYKNIVLQGEQLLNDYNNQQKQVEHYREYKKELQ